MAEYATNLLYAQTKNSNDLDKVEQFLDEYFCDCYINRIEDCLECEFFSKWDYPEAVIEKMLSSLESRKEIYIRVLTHELSSEYVSFRVFSKGEWDIRY